MALLICCTHPYIRLFAAYWVSASFRLQSICIAVGVDRLTPPQMLHSLGNLYPTNF